MSTLSEVQKAVQAFVLQADTNVKNYIEKPSNDRAKRRMLIYRNGYSNRLAECLANHFSVLAKVLGDIKFNQLIHDYLAVTTSSSYTITDIGKALPSFISNNSLQELADLERRALETLEAENSDTIQLHDLTKIDQEQWPSAIIQLHPAVQVVLYHYNVVELWQRYNQDKSSDLQLSRIEPKAYLIVRHKESMVKISELTKPQQILISAMLDGQDFISLCNLLSIEFSEQEATNFIVTELQHLIQQGLVAKIIV